MSSVIQDVPLITLFTLMGGPDADLVLGFAPQKLASIFERYRGPEFFVSLNGFALWINIGGAGRDYPICRRRINCSRAYGRVALTVDIPRSDWADWDSGKILSQDVVRFNFAARIRAASGRLTSWCRRKREIVNEERLERALTEGMILFEEAPDPMNRGAEVRRQREEMVAIVASKGKSG
jgi:hypothetical protein